MAIIWGIDKNISNVCVEQISFHHKITDNALLLVKNQIMLWKNEGEFDTAEKTTIYDLLRK